MHLCSDLIVDPLFVSEDFFTAIQVGFNSNRKMAEIRNVIKYLLGAFVLTNRKASSFTTHSACLATWWADVYDIADNTDSRNEQKTSYEN